MKALLALLAFAAAMPAQTPSLMKPASLREQAPAVFRAKFTTTKGDFVVEVTRAWAPLGADRFYNLVKNGFFTDASFFRVVPNFIVQFGMPADPKVGAAWMNANIKDDPVKQNNTRGTIVFAMAGPNTRTTQFFINLVNNSSALNPGGFAPFGKIVEGMEVVDKLYSGYGDMKELGGRDPDQGPIATGGKAYLDKNFPRLDSIKSAVVVPAADAAPAGKK